MGGLQKEAVILHLFREKNENKNKHSCEKI